MSAVRCPISGCDAVHTEKSHWAIEWQRQNPELSRATHQRAQEKRAAELAADVNDPRHGRTASYVSGCRCRRCSTAHTDYVRANRLGRRFRVSRNLRDSVGVRLIADSWHTREEAQAYIDARRRYPASDFEIHDMQETAA